MDELSGTLIGVIPRRKAADSPRSRPTPTWGIFVVVLLGVAVTVAAVRPSPEAVMWARLKPHQERTEQRQVLDAAADRPGLQIPPGRYEWRGASARGELRGALIFPQGVSAAARTPFTYEVTVKVRAQERRAVTGEAIMVGQVLELRARDGQGVLLTPLDRSWVWRATGQALVLRSARDPHPARLSTYTRAGS